MNSTVGNLLNALIPKAALKACKCSAAPPPKEFWLQEQYLTSVAVYDARVEIGPWVFFAPGA